MAIDNPRGPAARMGGLAAVIAARGGQAKPETPFVIEHREALIYMLCQAAELEHSIMCEYLFAAFSLKQRVDEGLTATELEAVTRWRRRVAHVASEEMLHLALVHNVLSAIGAAPHLGRPNLPQPARHFPDGVVLALVPFGEAAVRHFMFLERPEGMELEDAQELIESDGLAAAVAQAKPFMGEDDIVPRLQDFATVGHLYRSIEQGITHLAAKYGESALFVGPPKAQATTANFSWPELVAVTDLASAQRAIDTILEQGEGARGDWQDAHFGQFVEILAEYEDLKQANPGFEPTRPVMHANVRPCEHAEVPLISDAITTGCTDLFNVGYEVLLQALERYFAHTEESDAQLSTLADATLALMLRVLKPLGDLITTLPVGAEHPGMTAGPSFELFYESDYLMPHRGAAWALLEERLREAAQFCTSVQRQADAALAAQLDPVGMALSEIADSLAAHFPDWGGVSRYPSSSDASLDESAATDLLSRASQFAEALAATPLADDHSRALGTLFEEAHGLVVVLTASGADGLVSADRRGREPVATRLVQSVLRPLAEALAGSPTEAAPPPADSVIPAAAETHEARAEDRLWALALAATRRHADFHGPPHLAAALAEATAALQDLAVLAAPAQGPDDAAARLAQLEALGAALPVGMQVAKDGPYLVTNASHVSNWLGERTATRPQLALCRCGASQIKPLCDGSHANVGFSGEKDPHRVPDRLDTYVGQQVTIFDNRGICQHSGFCTDRLATVFHVQGDRFVTPSGGRMDEIMRAVRNCPSGALGYAIDGVKARTQGERDTARELAIEVSKDGPYRISANVSLIDVETQDELRGHGASHEHYALCRCGHSQNKPFCSGMHWYVDFKDPVADPGREPTMFEWCGGLPALIRTTRRFYEKYVPQDALLAPLFADMSPDHPQRVALWLGEVFGGPHTYSEQLGGASRMIARHLGKQFTEAQRARWVELMSQSAAEAGLPEDPEFQAAFRSYLEWGSRGAVEDSRGAVEDSRGAVEDSRSAVEERSAVEDSGNAAEDSKPDIEEPAPVPMPRWSWVGEATPRSRVSAVAAADDAPIEVPSPDEDVSYATHIKSLFRQRDQQSMKFALDLWSYDDVTQQADGILTRLRDGSMPCDGTWPQDRIDVFARWIDGGMKR